MFDNLTERLGKVLNNLRGQGRLTEDNIKETMREVRMALLEADVALPVVREFVEQVKQKAMGEEVMKSLTPGQTLIKIVNDELVKVMGEANEGLDLAAQPPAVILMAGLQGSGKTTSVAKLSRWLQQQGKKKIAVVSCDVYRPAAIDQLQTLAKEVDAQFIPSSGDEKPVEIAKRALAEAKRQFADVLLVDGSGVLHQRHAGIAAHLGVVAGIPTVGVTKKLLCGEVDLTELEPLQSRPVVFEDRLVGVALRGSTRSRRPIFISPGHRTDVAFAERLVRRLMGPRRLPEPLYWADRLSRAAVG